MVEVPFFTRSELALLIVIIVAAVCVLLALAVACKLVLVRLAAVQKSLDALARHPLEAGGRTQEK